MPHDSRNAKGVPFPNHHMFGVNAHWAAMLPATADPGLRLATTHGDAGTEAWLAGYGESDVSEGVAATRPAFDLLKGDYAYKYRFGARPRAIRRLVVGR